MERLYGFGERVGGQGDTDGGGGLVVDYFVSPGKSEQ